MDPSFYRSDEKGFWGDCDPKFPAEGSSRVLSESRSPDHGPRRICLPYVRSGADGSGCAFKRGKEAGIKIVTECEVEKAGRKSEGFEVMTNQGTFTGDFLILACGSKAARSPDPTAAAMSWRSSSDTGS